MPSANTFDAGRSAPTIRGRTGELDVMGALVSAVAQGRGGVLVIEGPPGIGKSRLMAEAMNIAQNRHVRTVFGEAFEYQQSVPFFSLFTAMLQADPPLGDVESLRRLGGSTELNYYVVHDLQCAIEGAAARQPLTILLEDIHWADDGTLLALRSLATARLDCPVLWVVTVRSGAGRPAVQETLTVLQRADSTFVRVPAMSADAVAEMVGDSVLANPDESLLNLAIKAHGNPFLVRELIGGLAEEGRLAVRGGWASATGTGLPRRLSANMQQRLDLLSTDASEVVRVAAVLPERFSAGVLAAMLERQPASLMSALAEAVRADLLVEDGDQLRFGHELLREAARMSLPQSLRRAMERQSASIMLGMGASPTEVATQLARSAERGDSEAVRALRQAAHTVSRSNACAAADLSKRALELLSSDDAERGRLVAETVALLNRARRYEESEELATCALAGASAQEEAEIRLRLQAFTRHTAQRRVAESRRALELDGITDVTRARHLALLGYNLMLDDIDGSHRSVAESAYTAAESAGDLESRIIAELTLACFDCSDGHTCRALHNLEELSALSRASDLPVAHLLAANYHANLLAFAGRLEEAAERVSAGVAVAQRERNAMVLDVWAAIDGLIHLAAGRLAAARTAVEFLPAPERAGPTELDMVRIVILAQTAVSTDDRNLLQQMTACAHEAYTCGSAMVRQTASYVLALAAWHRNDLHDAVSWFGGDINLFGTPLTPLALDQIILSARVAAAAGDAGCRAQALRAAEKLEHDADAIPLFAGTAAHVRGLLAGEVQALVTAADLLASTSRPLLYAAAAEDAGGQLIQAGLKRSAQDQLNAAFDTYVRLGAHVDARRVGRELRRLGVERRIVSQPRAKTGWESLTDSELKVVNLIARGASNRATADQLQLSLHTVKTHVHNVFTKLAISSRAELVRPSR